MYRSRNDEDLLSELSIPLLDIYPEGKLEREIKDIVDELGIMLYFKKAEKDVLGCFVSHACRILNPVDQHELRSPQAQHPASHIVPLDLNHSKDSGTVAQFIPRMESSSGSEESIPSGSDRSRDNNEQKDKAAHFWFKMNADELLKRVDQRISQLEELQRRAESTLIMVSNPPVVSHVRAVPISEGD